MEQKKYQCITGFRGWIVIMTAMGFHYFMLLGNPFEGGTVISFITHTVYLIGMTGPNAFFVMSGFLMHQRSEKRIEEGTLKFSTYLIHKMKKFYPFMLFTTLVVFAVEHIGYDKLGYYPMHASGGEQRYSFFALILSALGIQSGWISEGDTLSVNGPSWFISVLMICYILYYVIVRTLWKDPRIRTALFVLFMILGIVCSLHPISFPLLYQSVGRGLWGFFSGVLLGIVVEYMSDETKRKGCVPVFLIMLTVGVISWRTADTDGPIWFTYIQWICILYLGLYGRVCKASLSWKPMVFLGERSMSIFLGNLPIFTVTAFLDKVFGWGLNYGSVKVWAMLFLVSVLTAVITYQIFERWMVARISR